MKKILLIDDDADLSAITAKLLQSYQYEVKIVPNCEMAYDMLTQELFQLLILDINLPDGTGFDVCKELRKVSKVPVIFASARTSEDDKITGLDIGGDDYLAKPYSLKELLARVNALMRRTYGKEKETVVEAGNLRMDIGLRRVWQNGEEIKLSLKEFDVLAYLMTHPERIKTVWGIGYEFVI